MKKDSVGLLLQIVTLILVVIMSAANVIHSIRISSMLEKMNKSVFRMNAITNGFLRILDTLGPPPGYQGTSLPRDLKDACIITIKNKT